MTGLFRVAGFAVAGAAGAGSSAARVARLGVYGDDGPSHIAAFEAIVGRPVSLNLAFFDRTTWNGFLSSIANNTAIWAGVDTVWSVPLCASNGTLAETAGGTRDAIFTACAQAVLATAPASGPIYIRPGWEFNGDFFPWSAIGNEAAFVTAFRHVVDLFRAVSSRFRFFWCSNITSTGGDEAITVTDCYPGDAHVDVIGLDIYWTPGIDDEAQQPGTFGYFKDVVEFGLAGCSAFAAARGKPFAIGEFGLFDEATTFAGLLCDWIYDENPLFHCYWEADHGTSCRLADNPGVEAVYVLRFGPPQISTPAAIDAEENEPLEIDLTAVYPQSITWRIISGPGTLEGDTLELPGTTGSTGVTIRATNEYGLTDDVAIVVTWEPPVVPWTPAELSTAVVGWFDAAEASTLTLAGGNVSAWASRVGSFSASQGAAGQRPAFSATARNGLPGVVADGTDDQMVFTRPASWPDNAEAGTIAAVSFVEDTGLGSFSWKRLLDYGTASGLGLRGLARNGLDQVTLDFGTSQHTSGQWSENDRIIVHQQNPTGNNTHRVNIDGGATATSGAIIAATTGTTGKLFCTVGNGDFWPGSLQELLVINRALTTDERQKLEGYFAHKWALTGKLPVDHPYKTIGPAV
jgi:hypothetical protein